MAMRGENVRFWLPVVCLAGFAAFVSQKLIRSHVDADVTAPRYEFELKLPGRRGSIYDASGASYPLVKSVPVWEYHLDPVALTNAVVRKRGEPRRKPAAIVRTIADALGLDYRTVKAMAENTSKRYQFLAQSTDPEAHRVLADSHLVAGVAIEDRQIRQYLHGRFLSHVLGSVNTQGDASAGVELKFDAELAGVPGLVRGKRDARGRELYDKRIEKVAPIPGADIHLTIDHNLQYEVETGLADGLKEFHAGSGWCVILDAQTAAVLAMASLPDFDPLAYGKATDSARINRVTNYTYEPGSVMKVITAAAGIDTGRVRPDSLYSTDRYEDGYYRLPGDGSHVWEPRMSVKDAIVHSSNIVMGKLGFDLGQRVLSDYFKAFGFGARTGIELPGEECGILPRPIRGTTDWDLATRSRAPISARVGLPGDCERRRADEAASRRIDHQRGRHRALPPPARGAGPSHQAGDGADDARDDARRRGERRHGAARGDPRLFDCGQDGDGAEVGGAARLSAGALPRDVLRHRAVGRRQAPSRGRGAGAAAHRRPRDARLRHEGEIPPGRQFGGPRLQAHHDRRAPLSRRRTRQARGRSRRPRRRVRQDHGQPRRLVCLV